MNRDRIQKAVDKAVNARYIHGAVFCVSGTDGNEQLFAAGGMKPGRRYYIASINKLIVSAVILKYIISGQLSPDTLIRDIFPSEMSAGLHVFRGQDYTGAITIRHLLSHTSGLPCYLSEKSADGHTLIREFEAGADSSWPPEAAVERIKTMKPHFIPGEGRKAFYSDTNHQILTLVIEKISGRSSPDTLNELFSTLGMNDTRVIEDPDEDCYEYPYFKHKQVRPGIFFSSTRNDIYSTASDQMKLLKAFFSGYFWLAERLSELMDWKRVFFPFEYGTGIQKFSMPRMLSPFGRTPVMTGHCGSTGTLAFYLPEYELYITGSVNQQANPSAAFRAAIGIAKAGI